MNTLLEVEEVRIPGTRACLAIERDARGQLVSLSAGGRTYLRRDATREVWEDGFAVVDELALHDRCLRSVRTPFGSWRELYRWDRELRPVHVDGVDIERDARGRLTACRGAQQVFRYSYTGEALTGIETPWGRRELLLGDGHPVAVVSDGVRREFSYDERGARRAVAALPASWERDARGRLWVVRDSNGAILHTFLWDGWRCRARVDGPPGAPLAALFSLDPSATPVRVVYRERALRVPRDAFGESLLELQGVPGLFGAAVFAGHVHTRSRALDPRTGSFVAPDPLHGGRADPRRAGGFTGSLWAETRGGPYAICQHDPVARVDPLGEFSWLTLLSDLTWSMQNNSLAFFGLDWTVNFWASLPVMPFSSSPGNKVANARDLFLFEGYTGTRQDTWVIRRGGVVSGSRTFTFQHLMFDSGHELPGDPAGVSLEALKLTRAIDPQAVFQPRLYGSVLEASPAGSAPFALIGDRRVGAAVNAGTPAGVAGLLGWTRAGGVGVAAFPGSRLPVFPSGGLHLDALRFPLDEGTACRLDELAPSGALGVGTMNARASIVVPGTGLGLAAGALVLLTDATQRAVMLNVAAVDEIGGQTNLWLDSDPTGIGRTGLRLRSLVAPAVTTEDIPVAQANELNLAAIAAPAVPPPDYALDDALRFALPATPTVFLGADVIASFAVRLVLDAAPVDTSALTVRRATPVGSHSAQSTADVDRLEFDPADLPALGTAIVVSQGTRSLAVVVVENVSGSIFRFDRPLAGFTLAPVGTDIDWAALPPAGGDLSTNASAAGAVLSYAPALERTAPAALGFVLINGPTGLAARRVESIQADALFCAQSLPAGGTLRVERFLYPAAGTPGAVDVSGVALVTGANIALPSPLDLSGTLLVALALGPAPLVGVTTLGTTQSLAGASVLRLDLPLVAAVTAVMPTTFVVLSDGGTPEPALVIGITLRVTLDRPLVLIHGLSGLELVLLAPGGPAWDAVFVDADRIQVLATIGATQAQMPSFGVGDLVSVATGAATITGRVQAVDGALLTLEERNGNLPLAGTAGAPTVTLLDYGFNVVAPGPGGPATPPVPNDPGTGGARSGIDGLGIDAGLGGTQLDVHVWNPTVLTAGVLIGLVLPAQGATAARTFVASVTSVDEVRLELGAAPVLVPAAGAPLTVSAPAVGGAFVSRQFSQQGQNQLVVVPDVPAAVNLTGQLVALIPFRPPSTNPVSAAGLTSSGTVKVPNELQRDSERQEALINHEIQHTFQSALFGPLLFGWFPLLAAQIPLELKTDFDGPAYSAFGPALVEERAPKGTFLKLTNAEGYAAGDLVQITTAGEAPVTLTIAELRSPGLFSVTGANVEPGHVQVWIGEDDTVAVEAEVKLDGSTRLLRIADPGDFTFAVGTALRARGVAFIGAATLGPADTDGAFLLKGAENVQPGAVRVRRERTSNGWRTTYEVLRALTAGTISSSLIELTWGNLIRGMGKLFYGAGRAVFSSDPRRPATISADRTALDFADEVPAELRSAERLAVTQGDAALVAHVATVEAKKIVLTAALPQTGEVQVSVYSTRNETDKFDWHDYFPARVPDPARPHAITIEPVGGERLTLEPFHRVLLKTAADEQLTLVTAVGADGVVELEDAPRTSGPERTLLVALIDFQDPAQLAWANPRGMDWMRTVLDPWAQLDYRLDPESPFWKWVTRISRWAFGSRSWSLAIPGFYFLDNVAHQPSNGHLSFMEQQASVNSGDLYAPVARLERLDENVLVGDVARYWYFPWDGGRDTMTTLSTTLGDAPGVQVQPRYQVFLLPNATAENSAISPVTPNMGASAPAGSGAALADALTQKLFAFPARDNPTLTTPAAFSPAQQGFVPVGPRVERTVGYYAAFTQPGTHRLSVSDGIGLGQQAREQHDGAPLFGFSEPILFDLTVTDVTVAVGGVPVANGAVLPLMLTQRARVSVTGGSGDVLRSYVLQLLAPAGGAVLRLGDPLEIVAQGSAQTEAVELDRRHTSASPEFAVHGLHTGRDVLVPVRQFSVSVVNTLALFAPLPTGLALLANAAANVVTSLQPGQPGFLIVPTRVRGALALATVNGAAPPAGTPLPTQSAPSLNDAVLAARLGAEGGVIQLVFAATAVPEDPLAMGFTLPVGRTGNEADLTLALTLQPFFVLQATSFAVARGASLALTCSDNAGAAITPVNPSTATTGISFAIAGNVLTVSADASAPAGNALITVSDAANPANTAARTIQVT